MQIRNHVVVDGSNIATEGRSLPSLAQLDAAVRAFVAEHPTEHLTVVVDATFGHRIDPSERPEFDEAVANGELITAPAGAIGRGDAFLLQVADKADASILSNDSFQEFHGLYGWLFDEGRLIGGKPVPQVGWVFLLRSPVRGPISRKAVRDASDGKGGRGRKSDRGKDKDKDKDGSKGRAAKGKDSKNSKGKSEKGEKGDKEDGGRGSRRNPRKPAEILNEALPFIEFVGAHPVGSRLEATVDRFTSHGAYVAVSGVLCYVPLRLMGEPTPRSAREVLKVGEVREFAVFSIDPPRRGIDLALVAGEPRQLAEAATPGGEVGGPAATEAQATKTHTETPALATTLQAEPHAEEAPVTPVKRAATKKAATRAPAKKATAKKTTATKAPAKGAAATKATAKRAPAKKTATAKKAPAKKATATKATAKRATTAKKAPATKATAKKAPAKRATTAKKATAKKAPATKATAKRAPATKATAKRAPAKKAAAAKKATAKKAPAKRATTAKKATAKKATARR